MKKIVIIILAVLLAAGCGTSVNIRPEGASDSEPAKKLPKLSFSSVAIEIKTEVEDSQDAVEMFKGFLKEIFEQKNVKVVAPGAAADAKMTIVIKYLRKVSKTSRWFLGGLAGSAELKANIALITKDNNSMNFFIDVNAQTAFLSADYLTGYGGSTEDLLERTSKKITEEILL